MFRALNGRALKNTAVLECNPTWNAFIAARQRGELPWWRILCRCTVLPVVRTTLGAAEIPAVWLFSDDRLHALADLKYSGRLARMLWVALCGTPAIPFVLALKLSNAAQKSGPGRGGEEVSKHEA